MERRALIALVAVCGLGLVGAALVLQSGPADPSQEQTVPRPSSPRPAPSVPAAEAPPPAAPSERRTAIPRPARGDHPARGTVAGTARAAAPADQADTGAEQGGVDPDLPLTPEGLSSVADRMRPSIEACVDAWTAEIPHIDGRVVLAFRLGAAGVQDAWITEHEQVPAVVLGCFSAAVYEQDWPAAPDGVEVTLPFAVQADSGLSPADPDGQMQDKR